jgi:hypothetical protein
MTTATMSESDFVLHARAVADSGDQGHAIEMCRQYLAENPDAPAVARLVVQVMIGVGQGPQAVELCQDIGNALPEATWPWGQACEPLAIVLAENPDLCHAAKELVATNGGDDLWNAMQTVRTLLAAATWWPQLVRQNHTMVERTWIIKDQVSLHDELIDVLATKLSDPMAAREAREAGDVWKDVNTMIQGYWTELEHNSQNPEAWDITEKFFRLNGLWADLAKLLEASLEGSSVPERVALWTEIVELQDKLPQPEWELLDAKLAGEDRPDGPYQIRDLRKRIAERQAALVVARRHTEKEVEGHFSMPPWVIGAIAITIGVVVATILVLQMNR